MNLPKGTKTVEDEEILEQLIKDEIFIKSVEEEYGKVKRLFVDWENHQLVYVLATGIVKESDLAGILKRLKKSDYLKQFQH